MGSGVCRFFLILLLIPMFSAVKCGSLIEGEDSDTTGGSGSGSSSSSSSSCSSAGSVTISQTTGGTTTTLVFGGSPARSAQSFTVSQNTKISKVEFELRAVAADVSVTVDLYQGGANPTAGTSLASSTVTGITGTPAVYTAFTFSDISVTTGSTYYFVLTHNNDGSSGVVVETVGASDLYANGTLWTFSAGTWSQVGATYDHKFKITTCD